MRIFLLALLSAQLTVSATSWHLNGGAGGANNGQNWTDAFNSMSALQNAVNNGTIHRGDHIYLGPSSGGGTLQITMPESGTTYLYIQRATILDHGSNVGWNDSLASGQCVISGFPVIDIRTGYIDIDGKTGSGTSGYGIRLNNIATSANTPQPQVGAVQVYNGNTANACQLHQVEINGTGGGQTAQGKLAYGVYLLGSGSGWVIEDCYFHDMYTWAQLSSVGGCTLQRNYFQNAGSNGGAFHGDGLVFASSGNVIRWNIFENMLGSANTTYIEGQTTISSIEIYGNIYMETDPNAGTTAFALYCTPTGPAWITSNLRFFNNTIWNVKNPGISTSNLSGGSGNVVRDNIWNSCPQNPMMQFVNTQDHNILNTPFGASFIDPVNGNFHLQADTSVAWDNTGSPAGNSVDADGVTRTTSIGAFQYTGSAPPVPGNVTMAATAVSVPEAGPFVSITVNRINGSSGAASATVTTANGSATAGHDYTATTTTLNWADGSVGARTMSVPILNSGDISATDRTFTVTITAASGATIVSPSVTTVTILMQRPSGMVQWSAAGYGTTETSGSVTLTATRTGGSSGAISASYATVNGSATAGHDYTSTSGTLNWADGDTANKTVSVPILNSGDTSSTPRTFTVTLTSAQGGSPTTTTVTITMNPPLPAGNIQWTAATFNTTETSGSVAVSANRIGGTSGTVSVSYTTVNGSAVAGHDYVQAQGTLIWANGDSSTKTVTIPILNSGDTSTTPRTFTVRISSPTGGAGLGLSTTTVNISMTAPPVQAGGTVGFVQTSYSTSETAGSVIVSVTRTGGSNYAVTVPYSTFDGTAVAGFDYTAVSGNLSWTANENSTKNINISIINSGSFGPARNFFVTLGAAQGVLVAPQRTSVSIAMNAPVTINTTVTIGKATVSGVTMGGK